jgi:preprotein translocase subunit SecG
MKEIENQSEILDNATGVLVTVFIIIIQVCKLLKLMKKEQSKSKN